MAEDTAQEGASNGADSPEAEPLQPVPEGVVDPAEAEPSSERVDPQLIGLCVVMWIVALGILFVKWDRLRVDWYLGDINEKMEFEGRPDEEAIQALVEMAADTDVVGILGDEISGAKSVDRSRAYRMELVRVLARIPGPEALNVLALTIRNQDAQLRSRGYVALRERAEEHDLDRDEIAQLLAAVALGEPEPVARSIALYTLGILSPEFLKELDPQAAVWPILELLRQLRGSSNEREDAGQRFARGELGKALMKIYEVRTTEPSAQLTYSYDADNAVRDAELRSWESWFSSDLGGTIPEGQSLDEFLKSLPPEESQAGTEDERGAE